jgi:hypothetical protein
LLFPCFRPKILYADVMWRRHFQTALLILLWLVTPDLLCLMPGVTMTADEHECCEQMGSDCGKVPMPDMQACCSPAPSTNPALTARAGDYPELRTAMLPAILPDIEYSDRDTNPGYWLRFESLTPPPLISRDSFDILRV